MTDGNDSPAPIAHLLACPRCDGRLQLDEERLSCPACTMQFPSVGRVPWLFAEPHATLGEWRVRIDAELADLVRRAADVQSAIARCERGSTAHRRLSLLLRGYQGQHAAVTDLMAPIRPPNLEAPLAAHLALRTRLPPSQGLMSYQANLHRDWAWGTDENRASIALVHGAMTNVPDGPLLVQGAGAGRLAYDIACARPQTTVVALDFNPLLLVAARINAGAAITQWEFPLAPRTVDDVAVERRLRVEQQADNLHFVLADALRAPFHAAQFTVVVTPWFVDVVSEDLATLARRINRLLATNGRWVIFGSLAFEHADPLERRSLPEVEDCIRESGFDVVTVTEAEIPYLQSPASRHGRVERVVAIGATKVRDVPSPPRHVALPDWLTLGNAPVPLLESFKLQAMTTRIYAFVMAMIDGRRSVKDMARLMDERKLMPRDEAEAAIRGFLIKMFDEANAPRR